MFNYFLVGVPVTFLIIFSIGYVFHEILAKKFFARTIGQIERDKYIVPLIAIAFIFYCLIQAYLLHIFYFFAQANYGWGLTRTALTFGLLMGFFWEALQGGIIEVATFKMPGKVFWVDSTYHVIEGALTLLILSFFYAMFVL